MLAGSRQVSHAKKSRTCYIADTNDFNEPVRMLC